MSIKPPPETPSNREIVNTRVVSAPREKAFAAFSDSQQLVQWWGPKGFTNTLQEFDLRPGGTWRIVLHGPDGSDYPNEKKFVEVAAPERVVFDHLGPIAHRFQMTLRYDDLGGGKTRVTWRMCFESADEVAKLGKFIAAANEENFDRLEAHLAGETPR
jgi:uncharacterized protein YndB with AHSA1/START domain